MAKRRGKPRKPRQPRSNFMPSETPKAWEKVQKRHDDAILRAREKTKSSIISLFSNKTKEFRQIALERAIAPLEGPKTIAERADVNVITVSKYWNDAEMVNFLAPFVENQLNQRRRLEAKSMNVIEQALDGRNVSRQAIDAAKHVTKPIYDKAEVTVKTDQPVLDYDEFMRKVKDFANAKDVSPKSLEDFSE